MNVRTSNGLSAPALPWTLGGPVCQPLATDDPQIGKWGARSFGRSIRTSHSRCADLQPPE